MNLSLERLAIQPNHVFIIPEQRDLHVLDDEFRLKPRGWRDVITVFLRSITQHWEGLTKMDHMDDLYHSFKESNELI